MLAFWIILIIFAVILAGDYIHGSIYGFENFPRMIFLPGFSFSYLIEANFYYLFYASVVSMIRGPFYDERSEDMKFSIGTSELREDWMAEGFYPIFTGWVFYRAFITYTR